MRAIDTNVLVRLLTRDDPQQLEPAEAFVAKGAWVSHLVLAETIWVLSAVYDLKRDATAKAVEMLLGHEHIVVQESDVVASALEHYRGKVSVDFSDCLILAIARKAGHLPLGTFDRNLSRLDGAERL
jgi:predicted nucleic-acid-binding protein